MYGTLDNKHQHEASNTTGAALTSVASSQQQTGQLGSISQQAEVNNQGSTIVERKKRIYSHCHVQEKDNDNKRTNLSKVDKSARRRLIAASIICLLFMIGEVVGGVLSNSLAIASDAAHLLTDFASFMISLFAIWLASRPASRKMSFGWYRAEVIGALLSVLMIWLVTGLLVYLAIERLRTNEYEIDSQVMVITASAGLLVNIIMAVALNFDGHGHFHGHSHAHGHHHGHGHGHHHGDHDHESCSRSPLEQQFNNISIDSKKSNSELLTADNGLQMSHELKGKGARKEAGRGRSNINVRAAFIHVVGDFLQSLGVLIAALVIHFEPTYSFIDPICTFLFSIIVLITTINIIRDATNVLMEGIPDGINFIEVGEKLQELPGVIRVHNLRIWSLSLDKIAISTHLVIDDSRTPSQALKMAIDTLKSSYNFFEVTIQVEEYREDMKDCEHCQDEEVIVEGAGRNNDNNTAPPTAVTIIDQQHSRDNQFNEAPV